MSEAPVGPEPLPLGVPHHPSYHWGTVAAPPLLGLVQQDSINPGDGAAAVFELIVPEVLLGDAELLQRAPDLLLFLLQAPGLRVVQALQRARQFRRHQRPGKLHRQEPITAQHLVDGVAVRGGRLQDALDEPLAGPGHPWRDRVGGVDDAAPQLPHGLSAERHGAGHHEEEQDPHSPHVHWGPLVALVLEELWGGVGWRATEGVQGVVAIWNLRAESKVGHLDAAAAGEQDVLRLQVPVDDVDAVLHIKYRSWLHICKYQTNLR